MEGEVLIGGVSEVATAAASSGFDLGMLAPFAPFIVMAFSGLMIFLNWKSSGLKSIAKRFTQVKARKAEIAHEIVANDEKQVQLTATLERTEALTDEQEEKIAAITEKAAQDIKTSLAGTDLKATVNSIKKKWNQ